MTSSLVLVSALVFSLLKSEWNVEEYWLMVDNTTETLMISTWEKIELREWERVLEVTLARKKENWQIKR